MTLDLIIYILFMHWFGDFVVQSRWMGENKSHNFDAMNLHILTYGFVLLPFGILFALFNALAHYATDTVTSNITSYAYQKKKMSLFWGTIGFDQFLHTVTLLGTYRIFN